MAAAHGAIRRLALGLALAAALTGVAGAAGPFERGMQALLDGNYAEAYCQWKPLAARGHAEAQYNLGWLYANGNGMNVDVEKALTWWAAAATQGHADAQFAVGLAYVTGEGIDGNVDEAFKWFMSAARQGHQDSRDILLRLNGDPDIELIESYPELEDADWFGWYAVVKGNRVNLRGGPGTGHPVVEQVSRDTRVKVIGGTPDWRLISYPSGNERHRAWIFASLLAEERAPK